jgi:uncharacterized protein
MKDAKQLLLDYTGSGAVAAGDLFAEDGALELPYLASLGLQPKYTGPREIAQFLTFLHDQLYPGFHFDNVQVHIATPDQAFGEYLIDSRSGISGKPIRQQFYGHLIAEDGKIKLLREAIDVIVAAEAIFPGGLEEVVKARAAAART